MASTAATAAWPRREVHVVGLVGTAHMLSHLYMLALVPLYPLIQPEIGTTWTGIGAAITVFALVTGILQTPVGFLVDRIGGRVVLIGGLFIFALAIGLIGFVDSLWQMMGLMALAGIGNSVFHPADYSIISAAVHEKRLGRAFAIHTLGGHVGFVAAPIVMVALESVFGWRDALMVIGALGVALTLFMAVFARVIGHGGETRKKDADALSWRMLLTSRRLLLLFVFYVGSAAANSGIINFSVKAFNDIYGMPLAAGAVVLTVYQAMGMLLVLPGGSLADRTRRYEAIMVGGFALAGVMVIIAGLGFLPFWLLLGVMGLAGAARGLVNASRDVSVRHAAEGKSVGTVFAFVTTGFLLGQAIAPPIYGVLLDYGSPEIVFWVSAAFSLLAIGTVFMFRGDNG